MAFAAFIVVGGLVPRAPAAVWSSPPTDIDPSSQYEEWGPRLSITPDGTAWVVWMGVDRLEGDEEVMYSRWSGTSWDAPATVNPPNQTPDRFPQVGVAPDGTVWCLWAAPAPPLGDYRGVISRWTETGWTWPDTVWSGGDRYDKYDLTPASQSDVWVGRSGYVGGSRDVFLYHWQAGAVVSEYHYDEPDSDEAHPSIATDQSGTPWATWYQQPPISPPQTRLQVTRYIGGAWEPPQRLDTPVGTDNPFIRIGPDNVPWIVCLARDPVNGYLGQATWAVRWNGTGWDLPQRISDPIASNDSTQFQLSLSRNPGGLPRAVWGRRNKNNSGHTDVMTSAWTGVEWTPPEIAGDPADSAYVEYPDIAARSDTIWVSFMRYTTSPAILHAWTVHTVEPTTAVKSVDFSAYGNPDGVALRWHLYVDLARLASVRILRLPGAYDQTTGTAPAEAAVVLQEDGAIERIGSALDRPAGSPSGSYSYWMQARLLTGDLLWAGPRAARFFPAAATGWMRAAPNPSAGGVSFEGSVGISGVSSIQVFDLRGRLVRTIPVSLRGPGNFVAAWDGHTDEGTNAACGVYVARMGGMAPLRPPAVRIVLLR